ncbi:lactam utilization protein LamB [Leuconostoc mesenteroides subsp. mesenteroides]|uniref:5-oxoprolinase subunit A n=3 Tax=Leuconostoc mesenteroides TaxID=1245 RepID=Q03XI2_LEUMM|nr:Lactam utilization protein B related protein [Leuconostoc mesenteroides subsp. mesenteroides ATCC 8293]ARN63457.1 lactam utilization protein LamB [Leuconostoc mesenteroides subsp. mesenteroides]MCT3041558.1 5-oxoprolinase subunit PxpA [Leuconostoc mesenteroides]MCT3045997.1 5-oxoprolinase subunit PxpA [Leuconostoc mesenteroides]ORI90211.1 lactam utilization protein LamB [Leuconostoc mesenteroides subsp. mesenteroides]
MNKMIKVDFNSDLGESFGNYKIGLDSEILHQVTSANVACGFHAGDASIMAQTVQLALDKGVAIGAHPGFPDLQGFGRRKIEMNTSDITDIVAYQVGALSAFTPDHKLHHVKAHGALYNMAAKDRLIADAVITGIKLVDPQTIVYGLANSELIKAAQNANMKFAQEVFADRNYQSDGSLVPRSQPNAVISNPAEAAQRALEMVEKKSVVSVTGEVVPLAVDSICVHGDNHSAVDLAIEIKKLLLENQVTVTNKIC